VSDAFVLKTRPLELVSEVLELMTEALELVMGAVTLVVFGGAAQVEAAIACRTSGGTLYRDQRRRRIHW